MKLSIAVAVVTLAGCHKSSDEPTGTGSAAPPGITLHKPRGPKPPSGAPRPQDKLTVTVDGKPVVMATALAYRTWNGMIRMTASSLPIGCDEITGDMREFHDGEVTFDVDVAQGLKPDGSTEMQTRATSFGSMTHSETVVIAGAGDGTPGVPTTANVDFTVEDGMGSGAKKIAVKGTIDALGCTPVTKPSVQPPPPEMPATLEVAGKKLSIRGAFLSKIGDWPELHLTTGSEGCTQVPFAPPSPLELTLTWMKPGADVGQAELGGSLVAGHGADQTFDKKKLVVTPAPPVAGSVSLKGDLTISGFPVKLDGTVTVVACPK